MATATLAMAERATGFRYLADAQVKANSPYGLPIIEDVRQFELGPDSFFSGLSQSTLEEMNRIKHTSSYPEGAIVLMEGQAARGIYIVCQGRVKLMTTNSEGKTLIVKIAHPGEVLGLQSVVTGSAYELTVETLQPSQLAYIGCDQFLKFLKAHGDACLRATQHLSQDCQSAYDVIRSIGLCHSVPGKLARLLLQWSGDGQMSGGVVRMKMALTHEELAQLIGSSRETVTRTLSTFKTQRLVAFQGSMLTIPSRTALASYAGA